MYDNDWKILTSLEQKHFVKYLGVLIDSHLSWRYHIDYISSKINKGVGIIARLRHLVFTSTLLKIYGSLIEPYISYGLTAWGQAASSNLNKILILQKWALRLMYFSDRRIHAIPLFVRFGVLPLNMLYFKVARYSFARPIPPKFEHKLRHHKTKFWKNCHHSCIR